MICLVILSAMYAPVLLVLVLRVGMALEYDDLPTACVEGLLAVYVALLLGYIWWMR